jgi:hypothetical protein
MTSIAPARLVSAARLSSVGAGRLTPASPASRSTASGKLRPSVYIRKVKMSPCLDDEKQ